MVVQTSNSSPYSSSDAHAVSPTSSALQMRNSKKELNIEDLPEELICAIFEFLNGKDLRACAMVGQRFNRITRTEYFWKKIASNLGLFCPRKQSFQHTVLQFTNQKSFMLRQISLNPNNLLHLPPKLLADKDILQRAFGEKFENFPAASPSLLHDIDILYAAYQAHPELLQYVPGEVALKIIKKDPLGYKYTSQTLRNDYNFSKFAIGLRKKNLEFTTNSALILENLKKNPLNLKSAPKEYKSDKNLVLELVRAKGTAIRYAHPQLKKDVLLAVEAIRQDPNAYLYIDASIKKHPAIVDAVAYDGVDHIFNDLEAKPHQIPNAIRRADACKLLADKLAEQLTVSLRILSNNGLALSKAPSHIRNNERAVETALRQNGLALEFASKRCKKNLHCALIALRQNPHSLCFVHPSLQNHPQVKQLIRV